jgi:hypothetical protein
MQGRSSAGADVSTAEVLEVVVIGKWMMLLAVSLMQRLRL